ncbi:SDR family NAD(P)-dependent oxidoreductase [Pseudofrankia asymbiotica]|uniref:Short-chain dehydrogenase n=1 Tax=Pseudofrankia asymbiotica TaxID=1834516 RepID=A0A1V2I9P0_9ACTN|nr:SDR family oxidoreductase [Pseudofrankia asymbiotica]ONH27978.1 hypothetical protein BL253_20420 [Pseudofrankia asymbiotica]
MNLAGGRAVVTGAATGIGRALALEIAARGAEVVVIDVDSPDETVALVRAAGGVARGATADVRDAAALGAVAADLLGPDGTVDLVCANAGIGASGTVDTLTGDGLRDVLDVNVVGTLHTIQAFLPALRRARAAGRAASVLVTGSEHSLGVPPYVPPMTAYTVSKHALLGLAACLRRDLADDRIGVSLLCPSYVRTERLRAYAAAQPAIAEVLATYGQDGDVIARRALDGIASGAFVIPTNRVSHDFVVDLHHEVIAALEKAE